MGYRFIQGNGQIHIRKDNVGKLVSTCMKNERFLRGLKTQAVDPEDVTTLEHLYEVLDITLGTHVQGDAFSEAESGDVVDIYFNDDKWCGLFEDFLNAIAPLVEEGIVHFTGEDGSAWGYVFVNGLCVSMDFATMLIDYLNDNAPKE